MPLSPLMSRDELKSRLRDAAIWKALPAIELRAECRKRCVPLDEPMLPADAKEQKEQLLDLLLFDRCAATFREMKINVEQLKSCKAALRLQQEWAKLDKTQDRDLSIQ